MQRVPASWGMTEQPHQRLLSFPWEKEGTRTSPAELRKDEQADGQMVLLDSAQHIWRMWTPQNPISCTSRESNGLILAHYRAYVCWRNDENKHLRALKPFVPLLILSISSENH